MRQKGLYKFVNHDYRVRKIEGLFVEWIDIVEQSIGKTVVYDPITFTLEARLLTLKSIDINLIKQFEELDLSVECNPIRNIYQDNMENDNVS